MEGHKLFGERPFVVAGSGSPWLRRRRIALADLMSEPWCLPPVETIQGSLMRDAFQASGLSLPAMRVNVFSLQLHASLLATGRYLSIFPSSVLHFGGKQLAVQPLPVKLASAAWPVAVATLKKRTVSPVARVFIDCARKLARSLSSRAS
jgi:DNA-binding transcriptional LysR family regulator